MNERRRKLAWEVAGEASKVLGLYGQPGRNLGEFAVTGRAYRVAVLLSVLAAPAAAQMTDENSIRSVRAASNAAIAARDLTALRLTVVDDLSVTASSGAVFTGGDEMMARFATSFADPQFVTYVRTPDTVTVGNTGVLAAEAGHWAGSWRKPDGEMLVRGTYMAQWRRRDGEWRIRSELFVALSCEGSTECPGR